MRTENVKLEPGFTQVCIWPGTTMGDNTPEDFVAWFKQFDFRIQYLEEITTKPDVRNGRVVEGTGGRIDQVFAIHDDDIGRFAVWRLPFGIRWIDDALPQDPIYPERFEQYKSWED